MNVFDFSALLREVAITEHDLSAAEAAYKDARARHLEAGQRAQAARDALEKAVDEQIAASLVEFRQKLEAQPSRAKPAREGEFYCGSPNKPPPTSQSAFSGPDHWQIAPNGDRTCSFCGSLHEEDFVAIMEDYAEGLEGYHFEPTSKGYKVYAHRPRVGNASDGGIKFYGWHVDRTPGPDFDRRVELFEKAKKRRSDDLLKQYPELSRREEGKI